MTMSNARNSASVLMAARAVQYSVIMGTRAAVLEQLMWGSQHCLYRGGRGEGASSVGGVETRARSAIET